MRTSTLFFLLASTAVVHATPPTVLGQLGQSVKSATIYASPNTEAPVYYVVQPYEYLVVDDAKNSPWTKVFMKNGVYGYIQDEAVATFPYRIVTRQVAAPRTARSGRAVGSQSSRGAIAQYALQFHGTPYVWGGNDLQSGIDCSGFVKQLFGKIGMSLPRTAAEQALVGKPINRQEDLRKGDRLYFWDKKRNKIGHTGIYLGNGYFVHSSSGRKGVATDYLGSPNWQRTLVAARR